MDFPLRIRFFAFNDKHNLEIILANIYWIIKYLKMSLIITG